MEKYSINKEALKKLLPYGAIKEIAIRSNVSIFTVSNVINKGGKNPVVLKNIKDYLEEIKHTREEIHALVSESKTYC